MENLENKKCEPCEGGVDPLSEKEFLPYLEMIDNWTVLQEQKIEKEFTFRDFVEALAFVNECGRIAEEEGHHPDLNLYSWNHVRVTLYTHAIGGLSINDFIIASRIDRIRNT